LIGHSKSSSDRIWLILIESNFCLNHFSIRSQINLLTAKINNKVNITINDKIIIASYRDKLLISYDVQKLTKKLCIFINIFKQIINHIFLTISRIPQDKHNNFCNNDFFVTLQVKLQKIAKQKNTRYKKEVAKMFDLYI